MRVALCISGQMRTYRSCFDSVQRHILEPLQPDVFVHTWRKSGMSHKEQGGTAVDEVLTEQGLMAFYSAKSVCLEDFDPAFSHEYRGVKVPEILKQAEPQHFKGAIPCFYKMHACNELRREFEQAHGFEYDLVIKLRPDLSIGRAIDPACIADALDHEVLYFERDLLNEGLQVSDKLAFANGSLMDRYASVWTHLNEYWQQPLGDGRSDSHRVGERLMKHHVNVCGIRCKGVRLKLDIERVNPTPAGLRGLPGLGWLSALRR
ncbi:MAG: hypothetical protein KDK91_31995 [Gammaproteobacteria bacterium]|nr:hypothetical protein [Gammaproteobacteria bacterium]